MISMRTCKACGITENRSPDFLQIGVSVAVESRLVDEIVKMAADHRITASVDNDRSFDEIGR